MLKKAILSVFGLLLIPATGMGQWIQNIRLELPQRNTGPEFEKISLLIDGLQYDAQQNYMPYVQLTCPQKGFYEPSLSNLKFIELPAELSELTVVKFGSYISSALDIIDYSGLSQNEWLAQYKVFPFRKLGNGRIEFLSSFSCTWNPKPPAQRFSPSAAFKAKSELSEGAWIKVGIPTTGVYKIDYNTIKSFGLNPKTVNPSKVRVFGNGGEMLNELNSAFRYDDLIETPASFTGNSNTEWESDEFICFYGNGSIRWKKKTGNGLKFEAQKNLYSDSSFYFIQIGSQTRQKPDTIYSPTVAASSYSTHAYDYYAHFEENTTNLGKTGRAFYGSYFDVETAYSYPFLEGPYVTGDSLTIACSLAGLSRETGLFLIKSNSINSLLRTRGLRVGEMYEDFASDTLKIFKGIHTLKEQLQVTVEKVNPKGVGWLDYLTVNARRELNFTGSPLLFRDSRGIGTITRFQITIPAGTQPVLWDVTNRHAVSIQTYSTLSPNSIQFQVFQDSLKEFVIFLPNALNSVGFVKRLKNQNLHGLQQADYIIVYHPIFQNEAKTLGDLHLSKEGLSYAMASTEDVYHEFSSGNTDPSAIRDFIRMLYWRGIASGRPSRYVVLMGDGSYNNKSKNILNNSALIPTYQSLNSLSQTQSIATDDFYGLMDDTEGYNAENNGLGKMDLGIGRLTCRTQPEMAQVIQKIIRHYDVPEPINLQNAQSCYSASETKRGEWRNWLLFLGDDEDNALHMNQANQLAENLRLKHPEFNFDKIFLDAYQRISTPGGGRYPDASSDFVNRIKKGALIFNYTGHGGEVGLTAERLIDLDIIQQMDNKNRMPLFITATCEFSRYDDPSRTSAGEQCLLNTNGAALALMSTCRVAFSSSNYVLNLTLLNRLFTQDAQGNWPRLGDVIRDTKASLGQNFTYANFHLLGDPALTLHYPKYSVQTTSINGKTLSNQFTDTLGGLQTVTIAGQVSSSNGQIINNYNGLVYTTVFDREKKVNCLVNTPESALYVDTLGTFTPFQFILQKNVLYRGKAQVRNGLFSFTFKVPKDIGIDAGPGKISYYATNGTQDASGSELRIKVGGKPLATSNDQRGPDIRLFMNDPSFVNGGITGSNPVLGIQLSDSSGINTSGNGIGHDLVAILDHAQNSPIVLNDYYEADVDQFQSGQVRFPLNQLTEGTHHVSVKAWDIQNNSSTAELDFVVAKNSALALKHVLNYPNPFTTRTQFMFEHNQACQPLYVQVDIFTVSGKRVKTLRDRIVCNGYRYEGLEWDGRDEFGDKLGKGVYLYKLKIQNADLEKAEQIEKLVILN